MAKLTDDELSGRIAKAISNAEHFTDTTLATERQDVLRYYRGEEPKPMHKGDSKYVSRDVFDTVDTARATIIEAFSANNRVVYFDPEVGEGYDDAKAATNYSRHQFFKMNDGEGFIYNSATDGLLSRLAVAKVYFEQAEDEDEYEFEALTPEELTQKISEFDNYEFTETEITEQGLYSGTFVVKNDKSNVKVDLLQPEDFLISANAESVQKANFVCHRVRKSRSWFIKRYGEDELDEISFGDPDTGLNSFEKELRFASIGSGLIEAAHDESTSEATLYECYMRTDLDGSGISKLWKIDYCDGVVLDYEQVSMAPFATFVPMPIPHTFVGDNFAKSVIPIQNARTVLIRQIINHSMITNNPRYQILNGTLSDPAEMMDNRMGGMVNVRRNDGINPLPQAPLNPYVFNLIQMIDEDKEETSGISKLSQGLNKDAISTQNSQGMVEQLINASQQRTKGMARRFGQFIKDVFLLINNVAADHVPVETLAAFAPEGSDLQVNEWRQRKLMNVELSLGYAEQEQEALKWQEFDAAFSQDAGLASWYKPEQRYEILRRAAEAKGVTDFESLVTHPSQIEPPEPSPKEQAELAQLQAQAEYTQAQAKAMIAKAETDRMKAETDRLRVQNDVSVRRFDAQTKRQKVDNDRWVDEEEMRLAESAPEQQAVYNPS